MRYQVYGVGGVSREPLGSLFIEADNEEAARARAKEMGMAVEKVEAAPPRVEPTAPPAPGATDQGRKGSRRPVVSALVAVFRVLGVLRRFLTCALGDVLFGSVCGGIAAVLFAVGMATFRLIQAWWDQGSIDAGVSAVMNEQWFEILIFLALMDGFCTAVGGAVGLAVNQALGEAMPTDPEKDEIIVPTACVVGGLLGAIGGGVAVFSRAGLLAGVLGGLVNGLAMLWLTYVSVRTVLRIGAGMR